MKKNFYVRTIAEHKKLCLTAMDIFDDRLQILRRSGNTESIKYRILIE